MEASEAYGGSDCCTPQPLACPLPPCAPCPGLANLALCVGLAWGQATQWLGCSWLCPEGRPSVCPWELFLLGASSPSHSSGGGWHLHILSSACAKCSVHFI